MPTLPSGLAHPAPRGGSFATPAAAIALLAFAGIVVVLAVTIRPVLVLAVPAGVAGVVLCLARPAAGMVLVFLTIAAFGSLSAFTAISVPGVIDFLLAVLWVSVLYRYLTAQHDRRLLLWLGILAPTLYVALTALEIFTADSLTTGLRSFRLSTWYLLAMVLVAVAPWSSDTFRRVARGVAVVACLVGGYAVFRWFAGSAEAELSFAREAGPPVRASAEPRFFGSFGTAHQLAAWASTVIPFCLALALAWRGRWRMVALAAVGGCTFALLASDVRTGVVAALAGLVVTMLLYQSARAFPGPRFGAALAAVGAIAVAGSVGFLLTAGSTPESEQRFAGLLSPLDDPNYQNRLLLWDAVIDDIYEAPLGHGLGTSGGIGAQAEHFQLVGFSSIDSSYLKIAFEQGLPVMILFIVAMLMLLGGLAWRTVQTLEPEKAALGIGACSALVALMVLFYAGLYIEGVTALSGWILVGIGVAQFTTTPRESEAPAAAPRAADDA